MNEHALQKEIGLVICRRIVYWVEYVDNIRMVYEGIVELHKVHTEDYKFKTDKKNGCDRMIG